MCNCQVWNWRWDLCRKVSLFYKKSGHSVEKLSEEVFNSLESHGLKFDNCRVDLIILECIQYIWKIFRIEAHILELKDVISQGQNPSYFLYSMISSLAESSCLTGSPLFYIYNSFFYARFVQLFSYSTGR